MKKYITAALFIFWAIVTAILTAGLVFYQNSRLTPSPTDQTANIQQPIKPTDTNSEINELTLSTAEVAKHSVSSNCWMIIDSKIYNVTNEIASHPGGAAAMLKYCGKDASVGFATKDTGNSHSPSAHELLKAFYVGDLGQTIRIAGSTGSQTTTNTNSGNPAPSQPITQPTTQPLPATTPPRVVAATTLTAAEVAKHASSASCWMIINGNVYDLTQEINAHPGGASMILKYCGKDGTVGFATKDKGSSHSSGAKASLSNFLLGKLNESITTTQLQQTQQQIQQNPPAPQDDDEEWDD